MPMGGGGSSSSSAPSVTIPKAKKAEKDAFAYASAYNPILADYLGYEVNQGGRTAEAQARIDDLTAQMGATTDKAELKTLKGQLKTAKKDLKGIAKDAASDFTLTKRAPTAEELQQQEFQKNLTGQYQNELLTGNISPEAQSALDTYYGNALNLSQQQIDRSATSAAARRGMSISDTPIGDPYLRYTTENANNIAAAKAQGYLGLRSSELDRAAQYMSYLDAWKQLNKFQNPLAAGGYASQLALGMYAPRFGAAAVTGGAGAAGGGMGIGGIGGLMQGAGSLFGSNGMFSSGGLFGGSAGGGASAIGGAASFG